MNPEDLAGPCTKEESPLAQSNLVLKKEALLKTALLGVKSFRTTIANPLSTFYPRSPG